MEIGLSVPLQAEVLKPGSAVLPARLLLDVVRSLAGETLTMELRSAEQDVELICGASTFHLRTLAQRGLPVAAGAELRDAHRAPSGGVRADGLPRRPLGLAR